MAPIETDIQDDENTQRTNEEPPNLSEENNNFPEPDEDPEMIKSKLSLLCFINPRVYNSKCISNTQLLH